MARALVAERTKLSVFLARALVRRLPGSPEQAHLGAKACAQLLSLRAWTGIASRHLIAQYELP